jgi:hypothetical protein
MTLFIHLSNHWDGSKQVNLRSQKGHWGVVKTTNYNKNVYVLAFKSYGKVTNVLFITHFNVKKFKIQNLYYPILGFSLVIKF